MRRISFGMTLAQFEDGSKDVTRRLGWELLQPGEHLLAVDRVMGFRPGQRERVLGEIEVLSVRREPLEQITDADVAREGFPGRDRAWFVAMFTAAQRCRPEQIVTRIEFRKIEDGVSMTKPNDAKGTSVTPERTRRRSSGR